MKLFISSWLKNTFDTNAVFTQKYLSFLNTFSQQFNRNQCDQLNVFSFVLTIGILFYIQPGNLNIFMVVPEINRSKYGYILNILKNIASSLLICTFLHENAVIFLQIRKNNIFWWKLYGQIIFLHLSYYIFTIPFDDRKKYHS